MGCVDDFEGILVQTDGQLNVTCTNEKFRTLKAYEQEEILKDCGRILKDRVPQKLKRFYRDSYYVFMVAPLVDADGKPFGVASTGFPVPFTEIEAAKNYSILSEMVESTPDVIFIKDLDGRYQLVNSAASRLVGMNELDLIGRKDLEIFSETTARNFMTNDRVTIEAGVVQQFDEEFDVNNKHYVFHSAKGPYRNENGEITGTFSISRDVTQIKLADRKLNHSYSMLIATLNATADGILVISRDKKITHYNQRFLHMWNLTDEIVRNSCYEDVLQKVLVMLRNPEECLHRLAELDMNPNRESYDILYFKDGMMLERYTIPQILNGEVVGRVFSYRDITERMKKKEL